LSLNSCRVVHILGFLWFFLASNKVQKPEFGKKMEEQNKKFFADKPDEATLSPEMKEHYEKFEKMIKEHTDKFNKKMREHSGHFKQKFAELLEQQKNAQFPGK